MHGMHYLSGEETCVVLVLSPPLICTIRIIPYSILSRFGLCRTDVVFLMDHVNKDGILENAQRRLAVFTGTKLIVTSPGMHVVGKSCVYAHV